MTPALLSLMVVLACATSRADVDPRAAGPRYDRWEVVIARPRFSVFQAALEVLADSGYVMAQENTDVAAISTADRKARPVTGAAAEPGTIPRSDYPVRLSLVLIPYGGDSTRLSITGQYRLENRRGTVDARSAEWYFVSGIGEAILARLR